MKTQRTPIAAPRFRRARPVVAGALLALLALPAGAAAAGFELIPFAGYRTKGDLDVEDPAGLGSDVEVEEGELYGLAFDVPLTQALKLELMVSRQQSALVVDPGLFAEGEELGDLDVTYAQVGLVYQWQLGQLQPYVTVSGGLARLDPRFGGLEAEDRPAGSIGCGLKVFLNPNFGLRFEGRGFGVSLDDSFDDDDRCRRRGDRCGYDDTLVQAEATVGLIFAW
jgi:hypothetical protein